MRAVSLGGHSTTGGREKQPLFPQCGQRRGVYAGAETQAMIAVVEQGAGGKTLARDGLRPDVRQVLNQTNAVEQPAFPRATPSSLRAPIVRGVCSNIIFYTVILVFSINLNE